MSKSNEEQLLSLDDENQGHTDDEAVRRSSMELAISLGVSPERAARNYGITPDPQHQTAMDALAPGGMTLAMNVDPSQSVGKPRSTFPERLEPLEGQIEDKRNQDIMEHLLELNQKDWAKRWNQFQNVFPHSDRLPRQPGQLSDDAGYHDIDRPKK